MSMQPNNEKDGKSPILNNPYEEPQLYYDTDADGNLDYSRIVKGRRPYTSNIDIMPSRQGQQSLFGGSDFENGDPNAKFINDIRVQVRQWRENNYPGVTRITRELLFYWFKNPERLWNVRLFFCQREAIETAIYLNEVADQDPNIGRDLLRQLMERRNSVSENPQDILPRTAFKMATGTGKTVVMAMLILYNYLNKRDNLQDTRFVDTFLIIAPGITIRERLNTLVVDHVHQWQHKKDDYHQRNLVPRHFEPLLGGLNASITIINYQQLEPKKFTGKHESPLDGKMEYVDGKMRKPKGDKEGKQDYSVMLHKLLRNISKGKRMLVINDEAHHCYLPKRQNTKGKKDEETEAGEVENEKAMVWYEGLRQLKLCGYRLQNVYDLSATPYYLKGSGYDAYSLFPWVVSDFGLVDAIESGLVKIPFLPSFDNTHDLEEPKFRNIYKHVSDDLSKMGVRATKKKAKEEGADIRNEVPPQLPTLIRTALDQFVKDYEAYEKGVRTDGEERKDLHTTPPVFIIVCNNTMVSHEVFKYIAGYQTTDENGKTIIRDGQFPVFSNYSNDGHTLQPKKQAPTLLVDSIAVDDASTVINDEFKQLFADRIDSFKRDYAERKGQGDANKISDEEILREVVNCVGKPGTLGEHIRCVVSVSMLTEGWDANTVTHVMGIRAFGSQLLCEQVVGRALRRRNYDLQAYDLEGNELDSKEAKHRKKNVVYKFPPEYAHVIGVPFKTFKSGKGGVPKPPKPTTNIEAVEERSEYEIRFPNIVGYRSESPDGEIRADYEGVEKLRMPFTEIPTKTILQSAISGKKEILKSDCREYRDEQVVYLLTWQLLQTYYFSEESGNKFQLFGQLKAVVEKWYDEQIEVIGGEETPDIMRRMVLLWDTGKVMASIYDGIRQANHKDERITAILNYYNPEGSTKHVNGKTTKPVWATTKSHVNYVVADTKSWEQIAAKTLEEIDDVVCYVKNHFLGFHILYMTGVEEHPYIPDFIARVKAPSGELVNLIIEISGFSDDMTGHKDAKRHYTTKYWIPAANNMKKYGRWDFVEVTDINNIKQILIQKIQTL